MKKGIIAAFTVLLVACGNNKCVDFTPETIKDVVAKTDTALYTEVERAMLAQYFMQYMIVHNAKELNGNPFALKMKEEIEKGGFKECADYCEVIDYQRTKMKEQGVSEEEMVAKFKK